MCCNRFEIIEFYVLPVLNLKMQFNTKNIFVFKDWCIETAFARAKELVRKALFVMSLLENVKNVALCNWKMYV